MACTREAKMTEEEHGHHALKVGVLLSNSSLMVSQLNYLLIRGASGYSIGLGISVCPSVDRQNPHLMLLLLKTRAHRLGMICLKILS